MSAVQRSTQLLLDELDVLPYRERMSTLARRAGDLAATGELPSVLADLRGGTTYHRFLAVTAGQLAGDPEAVRVALDDQHPTIRAVAVKGGLRAGWLAGPDLLAFVRNAPADLRALVYRSLRHLGREEVADGLVDEVLERFGATEAVALLPACGPDTARRLLPAVDHAVQNWLPLARHHGDVLLAHAEAVSPGLGLQERAGWWSARVRGILLAGRGRPDRALTLLERHAPADFLPGDLAGYGYLAAAAPHRMLALLTAPSRAGWVCHQWLPPALLRRLGRLPEAELVELGRRVRGYNNSLDRLLAALPPARRGHLYDAVLADLERANDVPDTALVEVLPRAWREREARRVLTLDRVRRDEAAVRTWSAFLPWPEASQALSPSLRAADAPDRTAGYTLLLAAARRSGDPSAVTEAVLRLTRSRNEQDPVRAALLTELAGLARSLHAGCVEALNQLTVDATTSRDASTRTLSALGALVARVLNHHIDEPALLRWALDTADRLFGGRRLPPLERFDETLRHGQEELLFTRLRGRIEAGVARGEFDTLFAVTRALGRRAWRVPELQELLRRSIRPGVVSHVVRTAAELWLADPTTRAQRVAYVLDADSSTITFPLLWRTVSTRRTDLLDRVLQDPPPAGAFLTAGTRWIPGRPVHAERWLPRQQDAFVRLQARLAADAGTPLHDRTTALRNAAAVPGAGRDLVLRYVDSPNITLAEAALGALPWTDRPDEALPVLLSHAADDRARVSMYAAGRTARFLRPDDLLAPLSAVALGRGKVTSRKAAVRLLGRFGPPEAMPVLLAAWQQTGQHRDVRAAVVAAARERLSTPESWTILEQAVLGDRAESLTVLAAPPERVAAPDRPRYAALVALACASPDHQVTRSAWPRLARWMPWAPDVTDLVTAALTDLGEQQNWPSPYPLVRALLDHPERPERDVLAEALRTLVRLDDADPDLGGPAADRPARRRIGAIVDEAGNWAGTAGPQVDRAPARQAAVALGRHPAYVAEAAGLLSALLRLDAVTSGQLVAEIVRIAELVDGRPVLAGRLAHLLGRRTTRWRPTSVDPALLLDAAGSLAGRGDVATGLFAVALARHGRSLGWPQPWRNLLRLLRGHPVADVRDAAFGVSMAAA
ncbi:hypothetical protein ABTX15_09375 [Micromonospora sp. NPDC094482]|uniref:hypothetical protein n=1 Tax=unclassified Micromonospora TaxID=2617518 RepID=UPI003332CA31